MQKHSFYTRLAIHAVLIILAVPFTMPLIWMISTSLKTKEQIFPNEVVTSISGFLAEWRPSPVRWANYAEGLRYVPFPLYLRNTLMLCAFNVTGAVLSSALVAYAFAKLQWRGRKLIFSIVIATMILPGQVTMIPTFALYRWLGWYGTYLPMIVPAFLGNAFFIFLLRQFFMTIPDDLCDAARIDGCSEWGIFWRMMLPLAKPALATCALFQFLGTWNDFNGPLIYLNDQNKYTLAYGLQQFLGSYGSEWALLMAATTVFTIPIIILFFLAQRTFIQGIATTGSKG
ncbi:MAG TPA: carbohydrate ABC transporter permease [Candidatus Brocadiia bacterium]|nr:carbohydrate ABC transporter permease [Candidatus Brocadiia bacterium]